LTSISSWGDSQVSTIRQDAWSDEDDLLLAEVTLKHISEGSTQLLAFEEVGDKIGRTSAACGFRWNSYVRKKYEAAIQIAKSQRQKRSQLQKKTMPFQPNSIRTCNHYSFEGVKHEDSVDENLSMDSIVRYLRQWRQSYIEMTRQVKYLEKELFYKEEEVEKLKQINDKLSKQVSEVATDYQVVNDDYKALIQIMDRARKMAFLNENHDEEVKPRFKMDANGNLERIDI
jgi:prespore-specific regulator